MTEAAHDREIGPRQRKRPASRPDPQFGQTVNGFETDSAAVILEVVTPVIGSFRHCARCDLWFDEAGINARVHQEDLAAYPPEWREEWARLSDLIRRIAQYLGPGARVIITDARSVRGLWLWMRGIRRYPAFVLGSARLQRPDEARLWAWLAQHVQRPAPRDVGFAGL